MEAMILTMKPKSIISKCRDAACRVTGPMFDNIVNMAACIFGNIETLERGDQLAPRFIVNKQFLKK